jgi:hypothetical protein
MLDWWNEGISVLVLGFDRRWAPTRALMVPSGAHVRISFDGIDGRQHLELAFPARKIPLPTPMYHDSDEAEKYGAQENVHFHPLT